MTALILGASLSPPAAADACPMIASSDWAAWVDAMPGPRRRPTLHVTGRVVTPSAGYAATLREAGASRTTPAVKTLDLLLRSRGGMSAAVVTTVEVRHSAPAPKLQRPQQSPVAAVRIRCGGAIIATVRPVPLVQ